MNGHARIVYEITTGDRTRRVEVRALGPGRYGVRVDDGEEREVVAFESEPGNLSLLLGANSWEAAVAPVDGGFVVDVLGIPHELEVVDPRRKALRMASSGGGAVVRTQMPGRVVRVLVEPGDRVERGQPVVVVEAMKMENELRAPADGTVRAVRVREGDQVEARTVLVELD